MTVPTQPVTIKLADFGGPSAAGISVTARASDVDYTADGTFVGTDPVTGVTDASGQVVLNLFPNATVANGGLGTVGSTVRVTAQIPSSHALDVLAAIPNTPCNLVDYLVSQEPSGLAASEQAASDAQAARDLAQQWATKTSGEVVTGQGYGAKKYADDAAADVVQTAADRVATGADRTQTGGDRTQTGSDRTATTASAAAALVSQNAASTSATGAAASAAAALASQNVALAAAAVAGAYPNSAGSNVPRGLTQASVGAITAGSGGTNGTFALAWSAGNFSINPTGTFMVAGNVVTAVTITGPGQYIGSSPTVPTPSFAASAGLTGAAVALTAQFLVTSGQGYWVTSADGKTLDRYNNVSGVATRDATVASVSSATVLTDEILKDTASVGDVYVLGTLTAIGSTAANTSTYPGGTTDTFFPQAATAARGYLVDFSVRTAGGAGTGQVIVLVPDPNSQYGYIVKAVTAVSVADGINTFLASAIYTSALPAGSRVGYRILTGGAPRYQPGGPVKRLTTNAQTVGQEVSGAVIDYAQDVAVAFNLRPAVTASLDDRVTKIEGGSDQFGIDLAVMFGTDVTGTSTPYGNASLTPTGNLTAGANSVFGLVATTAPAVLESVTIPCGNPFTQAAGTTFTTKLSIASPNAAGLIAVTHNFTLYLAVGVTNVITGFGDLLLPTGSYVLISEISSFASFQYKSGTADGGGVLATHAALNVGDTVSLSPYANTPIFSYSLRQSAVGLGPRMSTVEGIQALLNGPTNPVAFERTGFPGSSLPAGWAATGAWTVSAGLTPPATGGWGTKVLSGTYTATWKHNQIAKVTINSADTITGICQSPPENSGGAALLIDGTVNKLRLYQWDDTGAAGTLQTDIALPAALTVGRDYVLELQKVGFAITGTFKDTVTQASCTVSIPDASSSYVMAHGKCGPLFISATTAPKYKWLEYLAPYPRKCRAVIIADSIGEGAYLGASNPSWVQQLANARSSQNDIVIAPRAGDETPNFLLRKAYDWDPWLPQFAVIALGTNDTDQNVWRSNVATIIAKAVANGAEPILCTQVPRTASQALRTAMNIDIRSYFFGKYRYIDMAVPVSASNAGVAWNPAYDFGDGTHPNAAGQNLMYAQALIDAPYLTR